MRKQIILTHLNDTNICSQTSNIKLFYFLHSTHIMYSAVADYKYSNYKISHSNIELIRNGNYITSINQTNVQNNINFFILDISLQ